MPRYIVTVKKLPQEERDVYRAHADPAEWTEIQSESVEVGGQAVYAQELDDEAYRAFLSASNLRHIEPDETDRALLVDGVEPEALKYHELDQVPVAEGVLVGVGDTGAPSGHPTVRLQQKWTWFSDDAMDRNGHGSWCCGAAQATGASVVSGKVLGDDGSGSRSSIVAYIRRFADYCAARSVPGVCSLSLGGPGFSQAYEDAISYALSKGVITVCAAGNGGREGEPVNAPANSPSAIAVAALDHRTGAIAGFSCRGPEVDIAAAGVGLNGLWLNGTYRRISGTSMATPLVARAAAHLLSVDKDPLKVTKALYGGALDTPHPVEAEGNGTLRAKHALDKLRTCGPKPAWLSYIKEASKEYQLRKAAWQACEEGR